MLLVDGTLLLFLELLEKIDSLRLKDFFHDGGARLQSIDMSTVQLSNLQPDFLRVIEVILDLDVQTRREQKLLEQMFASVFKLVLLDH